MTAKQSIQAAFRQLLTVQSMDQITVKQICDMANVNRQTFYYHYQNMVELLKDMIFLEIYDEVSKGRAFDTWKHGFLTTTRFINDNHDIFMNIYTSSYWDEANRYFTQVSNALLLGVIDECIHNGNYQIAPEDKNFVIDYYRIVFNGLMTDWMKTGRKLAPEELLQKFSKMIDGTICMALERFAVH